MIRERWVIVGGGIGGLSTALALARAGQRSLVIEQAYEFAEIGAGLQIGANATRAMARLGIMPEIEKVAVFPRRAVLMDAVTGKMLTALDLSEPYRQRYGAPYIVMHRSDLLDILLDSCRRTGLISFETGRRVTEVTAGGGGGIVRCEDGTSFAGDVIVGADGLRSVVRRLIDTSEPFTHGYVAYRGTMPMVEVSQDIDLDDVVIWIGPRMHLVQYPIRRKEIYNQVAVFQSDAWAQGESDWGTPEELDERFSRACGHVTDAVALVGRDRRWPIAERDPLPTWRSGRAVLVGDAAHPMLQYLGQGACQAMEDALSLADHVTGLAADPDALDKALRRFEEVRLPRASSCQLKARPWGQVWHTDDPVTIGLRNRFMALRAFDDYSEVDWLYAEQTS